MFGEGFHDPLHNQQKTGYLTTTSRQETQPNEHACERQEGVEQNANAACRNAFPLLSLPVTKRFLKPSAMTRAKQIDEEYLEGMIESFPKLTSTWHAENRSMTGHEG